MTSFRQRYAQQPAGASAGMLSGLLHASDGDAACTAALRAALAATGADQASVAWLEPDGRVRVRCSLRRDGRSSRTLGIVLGPESIAAHAIRSGEASLITDCEKQWPVSPGMRLARLRCIMAAPMRRAAGGRRGGILCGSSAANAFDAAELAWADMIALALTLWFEAFNQPRAESG